VASPFYEKRILYYASKLHLQQLQEGEEYQELQPTISVSFLDHVRFPTVAWAAPQSLVQAKWESPR
jgi:hypothetical protein